MSQPSASSPPPAYSAEPEVAYQASQAMVQAQPVKQGQYGQAAQPVSMQVQPAPVAHGQPGQPMMHAPIQNQQPLMAAPAAGQHVVYTQAQPMRIVPGAKLSRSPMANVQCPNCSQIVTTRVDYETGGQTWLASAAICLFGCWCGCCLIPFSMNDCQHAFHKCTNCGYTIGEARGPFF